MGELSVRPRSRFALTGSEVRYAVRVRGDRSSVSVRPCDEAEAYEVTLAADGWRELPGGEAEATLWVRVPRRAPMA